MKKKYIREITNPSIYFAERLRNQSFKDSIQRISLGQMMFNKLKLAELTVYQIKVKWFKNNSEHTAILFVGFKSGGYCEIYNNNYGKAMSLEEIYYIKIIKRLCSIQ